VFNLLKMASWAVISIAVIDEGRLRAQTGFWGEPGRPTIFETNLQRFQPDAAGGGLVRIFAT